MIEHRAILGSRTRSGKGLKKRYDNRQLDPVTKITSGLFPPRISPEMGYSDCDTRRRHAIPQRPFKLLETVVM